MGWMLSLRMTVAEDILSLAGLALLLLAGWAGDKGARAVTALSVVGPSAAPFPTAPALSGQVMGADAVAFFGQYHGDSFAAFAKLLIYGAAAGSLIVAPAFFERQGGMRAEYPLLIVFAAL